MLHFYRQAADRNVKWEITLNHRSLWNRGSPGCDIITLTLYSPSLSFIYNLTTHTTYWDINQGIVKSETFLALWNQNRNTNVVLSGTNIPNMYNKCVSCPIHILKPLSWTFLLLTQATNLTFCQTSTQAVLIYSMPSIYSLQTIAHYSITYSTLNF